MQKEPLKIKIIKVIAYSRLIAKKLNAAECIALHLWAQQEKKPSLKLKEKFKNLLHEIKIKKWKKPVLKYDDNLILHYYCNDTLSWKEIENKFKN